MTQEAAHSSAALLPLATLRVLPPAEREIALERWVSWLNANRHMASLRFEKELDQALHDLRADAVPESLLSDLDARVAHWLETAGFPGEGRGPSEALEDI